MLATNGVGFREVGRAFLAEPIKVDSHQPWQTPKMDLGFGSQFGTTMIKLDISSLHWAVSSGICNVHVDRSGFTMQIGGELGRRTRFYSAYHRRIAAGGQASECPAQKLETDDPPHHFDLSKHSEWVFEVGAED